MSDLLTVSEAARILRVDDSTVRRWVKQGRLKGRTLGGRLPGRHGTIRIERADLEAFIRGGQTDEKEAPEF